MEGCGTRTKIFCDFDRLSDTKNMHTEFNFTDFNGIWVEILRLKSKLENPHI